MPTTMPEPLIYLDHHATTPCDPRVVEAMRPTFTEVFGNAASRQHAHGRAAHELVEKARASVATLVGGRPGEIVFTSGATESDNLAVKGAMLHRAAQDPNARHVVTTSIEHKAVLDSCESLERQGFDVTYVSPSRDGQVPVEAIAAALRPETALVSVHWANNETGVLQPVAAIGALCRERGVLFHSDGVQGVAYLPCAVDDLGVDLFSLSAHKMYGPKGVGALFVRRRLRARLRPLIDGGGHERGLRSGTLNVPGIVGFGAAADIVRAEVNADAARISALRDRLLAALRHGDDPVVNGGLKQRLPNNLNVSFRGIESDRLLAAVPSVSISSGAACTSASFDGSYVLKSMGLDDEVVRGALRFGLGRFTTESEIDEAAARVLAGVAKLRRSGPPAPPACG